MSEHDTAQRDRFLRLLAQQSREHAIILLDVDARMIWWNPGAEYIFGFSSSEMMGPVPCRSVYSGRR